HYLNLASRQFGADAPNWRDNLSRRTSAFLHDAFITRWFKRKSGARNNLYAVFTRLQRWSTATACPQCYAPACIACGEATAGR
ncbi:MAG: hypothetical protein L6437_03710, partial [Kiritimatiellae bacterium]|nr:hypothetical protein [Kiritimatiellia bacterium]